MTATVALSTDITGAGTTVASSNRLTAAQVLDVFVETSGAPDVPIPAGDLTDVTFEELGYDSLAILEAASRIGDRFGVVIPDARVAVLATLGEMAACGDE